MKRLIVMMTACGIWSQASALPLKEEAQFGEAAQALKELAKETTENCGYEITLDFDRDSFKDWNWKNRLDQYCGQILHRIHYVCRDSEQGKKAIRSQIATIICFQRPAGKPEHHTLKDGILRYSVENDSLNSHDDEWLNKNIKPESAGSLKEAKDWARFNHNLQLKLKAMNSTCDTDIGLKVDRKSFWERPEEWGTPSHCDIGIDAIQQSCDDESFRLRRAKKIKTYSCMGTKGEKSEFSKFKRGTATFHVGKSRAIDQKINRAWLSQHIDSQ